MKKIVFLVLTIVALASCTQKQVEMQNNDQSQWHKIDPTELNESATKIFADDWMVLSAGNDSSMNLMTIAWGGLGELWNKPVATVYVAPQRYTFQFLMREEYYTVCRFDSTYRDTLTYLGTKSGRDEDKVKGSGLTVAYTDLGNPYYEEANLVIECRKIYVDSFRPENLQQEQLDWYASRGLDPHGIFIGEIVNVWVK